jgi:hypothetical protein
MNYIISMSINEDETRKFFQNKLKRSGHILENKVESKLKTFFQIERQPPYFDKDEKKGRFGDMICSAFFPDENIIPNKEKMALGQLRLVIECKNLPDHGWIFFENEKKDDIIIPDMYNFIKTYREEDITGKCIPHGLVTDLFYTSSYYETFLDSGTKSSSKSNSKESNLYEAILTSIKSTRHQIDKTEELRKSMFRYYNKLDKILFVTLYQPLIIFTGHMYGTKNDEDLQSIKYVQLKKSYE